MSSGYLPVFGEALRHGPWIAGLCAFVVTPGALIVIAKVLERRWLLPREQFAAVAYGDPLLAVAAGLGVWLTGPRTPHGLTGPAAGVVAVAVTLVFGLAQWRDELRRGYYTRAQAVAPTKIWHQLVVYPVLGYWLWTAGIGGLSVAGGAAAMHRIRMPSRLPPPMRLPGQALSGYASRSTGPRIAATAGIR